MVNLLLSNDFISKNKITNTLKCAVEGRKKAMTAKKQRLKIWSRGQTLKNIILKIQNKINHKIIYGCESWTVKKAECRRIDAFELWCWRRLLRVLGLQGDPTSPF